MIPWLQEYEPFAGQLLCNNNIVGTFMDFDLCARMFHTSHVLYCDPMVMQFLVFGGKQDQKNCTNTVVQIEYHKHKCIVVDVIIF